MKRVSISIWIAFIATLISCETKYNGSTKLPDDAVKVNLATSEGIGNNHKDFAKLGYQKGERVPDFTLFSVDGSEFSLTEALQTGKALLLISGSYTCDISRPNLQDVNALIGKYKDKLNIYLVYVIDAHPSDVPSPYSSRKQIELVPANIRDHIEAQQPKTYGERKQLAKKWQQQNTVIAPILVDGPTNDFWLNFGQAPNTAYLITPNGQVYYKQTWFKYTDLDATIREWLLNQRENG